jgi:putative addiction module component (TIGR02574 family)
MSIAEIESMTVTERLQAIEMLWTSVSRTESQISSPDWHGDVLNARREKVASGKGVFISLAELRNRLRKA